MITSVSTGRTLYTSNNVLATSMDSPQLPIGKYSWQVVAKNGSVWGGAIVDGTWSEPSPFEIGGTTELNFENTIGPTLTWRPLVYATYDLWVQNDRGVTVVRERQLGGSQFTPSVPLPNGTYRAWIRAFYFYGGSGPWSEALMFSIDS